MTREEALKILDRPQNPKAFSCEEWDAFCIAVEALKESCQSRWRALEEERPPMVKNEGSWLCSTDVLLLDFTNQVHIGRFEVDLLEGKVYWLILGKKGKQPEFEELDEQLRALSDEGYDHHYRHYTHWMPMPQPPVVSISSNTGKNCE